MPYKEAANSSCHMRSWEPRFSIIAIIKSIWRELFSTRSDSLRHVATCLQLRTYAGQDLPSNVTLSALFHLYHFLVLPVPCFCSPYHIRIYRRNKEVASDEASASLLALMLNIGRLTLRGNYSLAANLVPHPLVCYGFVRPPRSRWGPTPRRSSAHRTKSRMRDAIEVGKDRGVVRSRRRFRGL